MTIGNFMYHLKHKSTYITIEEYNITTHVNSVIYKGNVGTYENWKDKCLFNGIIIQKIIPSNERDELKIIYYIK